MVRAAASKFSEFFAKYGDKRLAIVTHNRADVDAISSAYAISNALPNSLICTNEEMTEGAKLLSERLKIETTPLSSIDKKDYEGLVVVDTSAYTLVPEARGWKIVCIIDHHRSEGRDMVGEFEIIDEKSPSCAEIIANILPEIDSSSAFGLCVGIIQIWLMMGWIGLRQDWLSSLTIEAFSVLVSFVGFAVPGALGVQEGGKLLIFAALGLPASAGLTVGVAFRLNNIANMVIGLAVFAWLRPGRALRAARLAVAQKPVARRS